MSPTRVFTDGSAFDNGKVTARAGCGVFFGDNDPRNLSVPFFAYPLTNNRAELFACIKAVEQFVASRPVAKRARPGGARPGSARPIAAQLIIYTDSEYVINSMSKWIIVWRKRGWRSSTGGEVKNRDLIYWLDKLITLHRLEVTFLHVSAHDKRPENEFMRHGNDMADALATAGTRLGMTANR